MGLIKRLQDLIRSVASESYIVREGDDLTVFTATELFNSHYISPEKDGAWIRVMCGSTKFTNKAEYVMELDNQVSGFLQVSDFLKTYSQHPKIQPGDTLADLAYYLHAKGYDVSNQRRTPSSLFKP